MSGDIFPGIAYEYQGTSLTDTTKTACLAVGSGKASDCSWVEVRQITVVDSTGSVGVGAIVYVFDGSTERVLVPASYGLPSATEPLELIGAPIHLETGGEIRVKGANGHHVHIAFTKGHARGASAQGYAGQ